MGKSRSSISKARSYREIGEFWDPHDLSEYWNQTTPVEFGVDLQSEATYYPVEKALSEKIHVIAQQRGVSPETLLNLWLQEKVGAEMVAR